MQGSAWSELGMSIPAAQSGAWQGTVVPMDRAGQVLVGAARAPGTGSSCEVGIGGS